jgi:hypothetical protein
MSPEMAGVAGFLAMVILMLIGMPIAAVMMGVGVAGGMMSSVKSRVVRPEAQLKSNTSSIKFTATGRLPLILSKARPSGKSCRLKDNSV